MSLQDLINRERRTRGDQPETDEQVFGRIVAAHFRWDGGAILRTASEALTDANFHTEAEAVSAIESVVMNYDEGPEPDGSRYLGGGLYGSTSR